MIAEGAVRFDGLDTAIVGLDQNGLIIYDYYQMVNVFQVRDKMTSEEAEEYVNFNVIGVNAGNGFTVMCQDKQIVLEELGDE